MNIWEIIILFFAFQAVLIGVFFFFKRREERYANRILSALLLCFGFCIFYNTMFWSKLIFTRDFIHLNLWYLIPQSLIGPLFYFYIRSVVTRKKISIKPDFWHFIPAIYVLLSLLPFIILSGDEKLAVFKERRLSETIYLINHTGVTLAIIMVGYTSYTYIKYVKKYTEDIDLAHFSHAFKRVIGASPKHYFSEKNEINHLFLTPNMHEEQKQESDFRMWLKEMPF